MHSCLVRALSVPSRPGKPKRVVVCRDLRPVILAADMPEKLQQDALECTARAIDGSSDHEVGTWRCIGQIKSNVEGGGNRLISSRARTEENCTSLKNKGGGSLFSRPVALAFTMSCPKSFFAEAAQPWETTICHRREQNSCSHVCFYPAAYMRMLRSCRNL